MLTEFDKAVKALREIDAWWSLRSKLATYDQQNYRLRIDVAAPTMVAYCGQQSAGAKNYHDAPEWFVGAVRAEISRDVHAIAFRAYERERERLVGEIKNLRESVLSLLASVADEGASS